MDKNIKKLKTGSMIPLLKYNAGNTEPKYARAQNIPNLALRIVVPILNKTGKTMAPNNALGKRAANSLMPNNFILKACSQKYNGGFSVKEIKLMWGSKKLFRTNISLDISAKFISSQSNKCTFPLNGMKKRTPIMNQNIVPEVLVSCILYNYKMMELMLYINEGQIKEIILAF